MNAHRRDVLLVLSFAAVITTPAFGQVASNGGEPVGGSIPDFSGTWIHGSFPGFEPLASGPTSLVNRSRRTIAQLVRGLAGNWAGPGEPPQHGVGNVLELVGDYTNPILKPEVAEIVKKFGEISMAGVGYPNPRTQCWPGGVPFVFTSGVGNIQILQQPDKIAIVYIDDVRH